jgi:serine/threonine-protein kinase
MSPEQMSSAKHVDLRTDIWALGVILHEALTGKPPFEGESITQLVACVLTTNPPSLRSCRADLAEGLEPVVLRCLQKNPAARFQSVRELAEALAPFAPAAARDRVPSIGNVTGASQGWAAPPVHAGATTENGEVALPLQSRTPLWIGLGLLAAVLGVGASLAAVMALRSGGAQAAPPGVTPPVPATAASAPGAVAPAEPFVTAAASSVPVRVAPPPAGVQPAGTRSGASGSKTAASAIASTVATAQLVAPPANTPAPTPTAAPPKKGGDLDMFNDNH